MMQRGVALREHVGNFDDHELNYLMLTAAMERQLYILMKTMREFDEVVLRLQESSCTSQQVRAYSESVLVAYPTLCARLHPSVRTVHSASFNLSIVKIQEGREDDLKTTKKTGVCDPQIESVSEDVEDVVSYAIVERAHKRLKIGNIAESSSYTGTRYLLSMSDICKRLFSISGYAFTNCRRGILPTNMERQLFL